MQKKEKSKTIALIMAICLSFWTWAYSYDQDKTKFWVGLCVSVFLFWLLFIPPIVIYIWAIVDSLQTDKKTMYKWT